MTIRRIVNLIRLIVSYFFSRITGKPLHSGFPWSISIEPSGRCNLSCPECPTGNGSLTREKGEASFEMVEKILNQVSPYAFYLNLSFQGEPLLNQQLAEFIRMAKEKRMYVTTSTNGHYLNEATAKELVASGLDSIIISVDGTTQETYEKYRRGGSLEKVIEGIRILRNAKNKAGSRKPRIIVQFLVFRHNESQVKDIKKLGKQWGADTVKLKTAQLYDFENGNERMTGIKRFSRYKAVYSSQFTVHSSTENRKQRTENRKQKTLIYHRKSRLPDRCFRLWTSCVFTWDGRVVPCCFDKDAEFEMGNVLKEDFKDIWRGEKYGRFRKKILTDRKGIGMCGNCCS